MRASHVKIANRSSRKLPCILAAFITWLLPALILIATIESSFAASATWTGDVDGDWDFPDNWLPNTVPNGSADTATFGSFGVSVTDVVLSGNTEVSGIVFNTDALAFTITVAPSQLLTISGVGITNNSLITTQNFVIAGNFGEINFMNSATAGNNVTITAEGGHDGPGGTILFQDISNAGNATLIANPRASVDGSGGTIIFEDNSTGGMARVEVFGDGNLDISGHNAPGVTVGSIEGDGNVFLGANNLTVGSNNLSKLFSGVINDFVGDFGHENGSLTKVGTGTLTLTGLNDYTGITTINGGVLSISNDANLGIAPGAPVAHQLTFDGGTLQVTASFALDTNRGVTLLARGGTIGVTDANVLSYGGVITGTGSLTKTDTGTLVLSGVNTYAGATTVNGGTLMAGTDNTLPSQTALTVATGATFDLNNFTQSIGSLAGAGRVTLGAATLTTGNDNTSADFSGVISGVGGLTKVGTGTQILSGDNTYTGGTTISTGTLQLGHGGTNGSIVGDVGNSGTFAVNRSDTFTFGGVISGSGAFAQIGTGITVLTGANTYTGPTIVDAGALLVDRSIASAETFVNPGGLLGGVGIIGGDLTNSGIVSPGHSPGTLTVNGNYTQNANGTLRIEIAGTAPGQFDLLAVGGHASLAGTLQLVSLGNFKLQVGDKITFLTAGDGVSGSFDTIQNPFVSNTLVKAEINNFDGVVQLEGTQGSFTLVACNPNTLVVAKALDSVVGDPRAANLIGFLDTQPLNELCPELELIAPDELPAIFNMGVSLANIQTVNLERRMDDIRAGSTGFSASGFAINNRAPDFTVGLVGPTGPEGKSGPPVIQPRPENRWGVFVTGLGEFTDVDGTNIAPGYDFSTGGLTFGVDYRVSPNFAIGLTGGYAHTNADLVNNGSLDVNGGTVGAYATGFGAGFYVNAAAFGVFNAYDSHRIALLGTANGNTDGRDFNALIEAGYDWKHAGLTIGPFAGYQYTYVEVDSFTETGSLAPLTFNDQNANSSRAALGAKVSYDWRLGHIVVKPDLRAAWQHEFGDTEYSIVSRFANDAGNSFTVNGPAIGRDSLLIGAGATVLLNDRVSVYAYYDGELARINYSSNNVSAGVRVSF